jgi:hypothetical protein
MPIVEDEYSDRVLDVDKDRIGEPNTVSAAFSSSFAPDDRVSELSDTTSIENEYMDIRPVAPPTERSSRSLVYSAMLVILDSAKVPLLSKVTAGALTDTACTDDNSSISVVLK